MQLSVMLRCSSTVLRRAPPPGPIVEAGLKAWHRDAAVQRVVRLFIAGTNRAMLRPVYAEWRRLAALTGSRLAQLWVRDRSADACGRRCAGSTGGVVVESAQYAQS